MNVAAAAQHAAAVDLLRMIQASWMTQALGTAAELGVADALHGNPSRVEHLAGRLGCDCGALERLLRALESLGVVARAGEAWTLTDAGEALRTDAHWSVHANAVWAARGVWDVWRHLGDSVRHGASVRRLRGGSEGYAHFDGDPAGARVFHRSMVELTRLLAPRVVAALADEPARFVLDVGGGSGELIAALLAARPALRGGVLDLPHGLAATGERLRAAAVETRCTLFAGSFFDAWPGPPDACLLKSILHNWDDGEAVRILARGAATGARLWIIERLLPEPGAREPADAPLCRSDLNMLVGFGGRERTLADLRGLLAAAGLAPGAPTRLDGSFWLVPARRR